MTIPAGVKSPKGRAIIFTAMMLATTRQVTNRQARTTYEPEKRAAGRFCTAATPRSCIAALRAAQAHAGGRPQSVKGRQCSVWCILPRVVNRGRTGGRPMVALEQLY